MNGIPDPHSAAVMNGTQEAPLAALTKAFKIGQSATASEAVFHSTPVSRLGMRPSRNRGDPGR